MTYIINGDTYIIINNDGFHYLKNGRDVRASQMEYPLIIASTMGMFDKFPVNSQAKTNNGRYDLEYYHYVGPKASKMFCLLLLIIWIAYFIVKILI